MQVSALSRSIRQHKLSKYYYSIIFNRTSWLLNESNESFWNDDHYWEVSVKYPDQNAIAPLPEEILWFEANLPVYLKVRRNRLLQVHDISWKFRFWKYIRFDSDRCSKKRMSCLVWKPLWWSFLVNQRDYFCLKVLWKLLHVQLSMETCVLK